MSANALIQFTDQHSGFELPSQFALAGPAGTAAICFHNFYDQLFPGADVPVDLHLFGFDASGTETGTLTVAVRTGEAVQVPAGELRMTEPGLVVVAAIPRFDLPAMAEGKFKLRKLVGTGFYMIWENASGHADTMHEWLAVSRAAIPQRTSYTVFRHADGRIARCGVVLLSPTLDVHTPARAQLAVFAASGRRLAVADMPNLGPMASRLILLDELVPGFSALLAAERIVTVRVDSQNIAEPLSFEEQLSGDFHIQHF